MTTNVDAHAIITALLNDAIKDEAFEKAIQYRKYRDLLDQLKSAIQAEEFDKCIELKKTKSTLELAMPEFDEKRKLLESLPPPPTTAPPKKLAGDVSQSDDSDESVVKGGKLASAVTATAKARLLSGTASAAASPPGTPSAAAAAPGAVSAAGAKPVVKLSAAELEARWAKFAPKPLGGPARGAGAAQDDSAVNRTSWNGGFTLQNKKAAASPAPAADDDDDDKATLDEESGSVLESKKPKKKKKDKADKEEKKKKKALPPKKSKIMSSTWAADLGGASFAELAKEKASAKAARTTDVKKKKKKKVKGLAMVTDAIKPKRVKQATDDSDEVDSDLVAPKSALKVGGNTPQPQSPTGGLSRAKDAPDAETSRRAYELRLAQARSVSAAKVDATANAAKDATPGGSKKVGFIEMFKSKK